MNIAGYDVVEGKGEIIIKGVQDFHPVHTFECGQSFRWIRQQDGSHTGAVDGRVVNVSLAGEDMVVKNASAEDFKSFWLGYFDMGRDYASVKKNLGFDPVLIEPMKFGWGIRLLRQDIWEMLISFIISANNMIPRIMKSVDRLSEMYGRRLEYGGKFFYTFPAAEELAESDIERVAECRAGFRCKYIHEAARMVAEGRVDLCAVREMDTRSARKELQRVPGVGPKVADCILLYSGTKYDVFPTDVWVKRVMEELYFKREASMKEILDFATDRFGNLMGFAQQYLFYYAREHRIGA